MKLTKEQIDNPTNEAQVLAAVRKALKDAGWLVIRNQQNIGSYKGIADLIIIKDGVHIWLEIKGPKGNLREEQEIFCKQVVAAGGAYMVARHIRDVAILLDREVLK